MAMFSLHHNLFLSLSSLPTPGPGAHISLPSVHLYLFYNFTTDLVSLYWSFVVTIVTFYISKLGKNLFPILETKDKGFRNVFSWQGDC